MHSIIFFDPKLKDWCHHKIPAAEISTVFNLIAMLKADNTEFEHVFID